MKTILTRFLAVVGGLTLLLLLMLLLLLPLAPRWLVQPDAPRQADYIVLLSGDFARALYAADLYQQGYAPQVLVSQSQVSATWRAVMDIGVSLKTQSQIYAEILQRKGMPQQAIQTFGDANLSTYDEALALRQRLGDGERSLLVVTTDYHTRRVKMVFQDVLPNARVLVVASPYYQLPEQWWLDYDAARYTVLELAKTAFYLMGGRFSSN